MKKLVISLVLAALGSTAFATNLIANGDFESYAVPFSDYQAHNAGSTDIAFWTVGGTSVDLIKDWPGTIAGTSVDMLGTPGPGSIWQTFASMIGQHYYLSFDLSANGAQLDNGNMIVKVNDVLIGSFTGVQNNVTHYTLNFTAQTGSTTLMFSSAPVAAYGGPVLDNVSVTAVPEPETYALMLGGLALLGAVVRRSNIKRA